MTFVFPDEVSELVSLIDEQVPGMKSCLKPARTPMTQAAMST